MVLYKRNRDQIACDENQSQPSAKRSKASPHNHPPHFWDTLSKITLTRKALKEFDRRTATERTSRPQGIAKKPTRRLLRSDTKRLVDSSKHGGPNLSSLRGLADFPHAIVSMSKASSRSGKRTRDSGLPSSKATTKTSTTGVYDPQFQQKLIDRGVFPEGYEDSHGEVQEPGNITSLHQLLSVNRDSLSPSRFTNEAFKEFQRDNRRARSESQSVATIMPIIAGEKDKRYETAQDKSFTNLEKVDPDLKAPQPDIYYGARLTQIVPQVRADLGKYIIPSTNSSLPAVPNFFFEGKSAAGRPDVAQRQVMHDNAYGARGMFQLQNYGKEAPVYDSNAYTIGSSYCDGQLKLYATHPRPSASGEGTEFHMTQLGAYAMTHAPETFRQGAAAYRNSRDFTQEKRDQFITDANAVAQRQPVLATPSSGTGSRINLSAATTSSSFDSETSADELAIGYADSFANHDRPEPEGYRPHKRVAQNSHTSAHLRSRTNASTTDVHAKNGRSRLHSRQAQSDHDTAGDDEEEDDEDAEEEEEEEEEEDQASRIARQAQSAMKRLLEQGHSKNAAFEGLVLARQQSQQVARQAAVTQVRAMLAYRV